jgi:hypothetical protein
MTRWKASAIHLSISAAIALIAMTLMLSLWFAPPFFSAAGGKQVLLIMLGVDVTLGPLITLIIFNLKKSRKVLTFDFSIIAILQATALVYGLNVMFHARPVFVVFIKDSFDMVVANELSDEDIRKATIADYRTLPVTGPVYVYSQMPADIKERNEIVFAAFSGKDLPLFPKYYQPYAAHAGAAGLAAQPIAELKKLNPARVAGIDDAIREGGWRESDIGFLPLRSKFEDMAVLVSKHDGKVLTMLKMWPWKNVAPDPEFRQKILAP